MVSDARFGIELYDEPDETQRVADVDLLLVGHVWSPDAERIAQDPGGAILIVDPSGRNPQPLNSSLDATVAFLEAFRVFYLGDRPAATPKLTVDEARARLAALQRGETLPAAPTPERPSREARVAELRATLTSTDPAALASGSWWSRILERPEFDAERRTG